MTTEYNYNNTDKKMLGDNYEDQQHQDDDKDDEIVREYYTSNNKQVRNGVYGSVYPFSNGSAKTRTLFSVMDATGRCDSSGIRLKSGKVNKTSNLIYYDNPEQYMQHRKVRVQKEVIDKWRKGVDEYYKNFKEPIEPIENEEVVEPVM